MHTGSSFSARNRNMVCKPNRLERALVLTASASLALFAARPSAACTTFLAQHEGQPVFGRNYDWDSGAGLVVVNPRGQDKRAMTLSPEDTPLGWVAKYASITFNQYGVELPTGGMNEAGLVVEQMWLDSTVYPAADLRPTVNELQWIQYALDGFSSVDQLANTVPAIRLSPVYAKVHYLVCDASSDCAVFEHLAGKLVVTRGSDLPVKALANNSYSQSVAYLPQFVGFGGTTPIPASENSLDRFTRAASLAQTTAGTSIPTTAFSILTSVAQSEGWTKWSIVYAPKQGTVYFRTNATPKVKSVRFQAFALDCPNPRKTLDIDADLTGDVSVQFADYSAPVNRALVAGTLAGLQMPAAVVDLVAAYPDSVTCTKKTEPNPGLGGAAGASNALGAAGSAGTPNGQTGGAAGVPNGSHSTTPAGGSPTQAVSGNGGTPLGSMGGSSAAQPADSSDSGCSLSGRPQRNAFAWSLSTLGLALLLRRRRGSQTG